MPGIPRWPLGRGAAPAVTAASAGRAPAAPETVGTTAADRERGAIGRAAGPERGRGLCPVGWSAGRWEQPQHSQHIQSRIGIRCVSINQSRRF